MHESALGCMRVHLDVWSALGCLECRSIRVHWMHERALGCARMSGVHLDVWSALGCHESALDA